MKPLPLCCVKTKRRPSGLQRIYVPNVIRIFEYSRTGNKNIRPGLDPVANRAGVNSIAPFAQNICPVSICQFPALARRLSRVLEHVSLFL